MGGAPDLPVRPQRVLRSRARRADHRRRLESPAYAGRLCMLHWRRLDLPVTERLSDVGPHPRDVLKLGGGLRPEVCPRPRRHYVGGDDIMSAFALFPLPSAAPSPARTSNRRMPASGTCLALPPPA